MKQQNGSICACGEHVVSDSQRVDQRAVQHQRAACAARCAGLGGPCHRAACRCVDGRRRDDMHDGVGIAHVDGEAKDATAAGGAVAAETLTPMAMSASCERLASK